MGLLGALTRSELDRLWWLLLRALGSTCDEIAKLERMPATARDLCYGRDVLGQFTGMRDELLAIVDQDIMTAPGGPDVLSVRL